MSQRDLNVSVSFCVPAGTAGSARSRLWPAGGRAAEVVARARPPQVRARRHQRRVDQLAARQRWRRSASPLWTPVARAACTACRPGASSRSGRCRAWCPASCSRRRCAGLEHARDEPAELLLADHVDVLRVVGRHQRPGAVGLAAAGRVVVGQAERVAVLVRDHARVLDRRLGVDVVRADAGVDRDPGVGRRLRGAAARRSRTAAGPRGRATGRRRRSPSRRWRRCSRSGGPTSAARCCRSGAVELRVAVAAEPGEDHHEEVDDAVLVGVVAVVVDLRVGDRGGVIDGLAGRPAARVDVLQRADAGRARRSAPSPCRRRRSTACRPAAGTSRSSIRLPVL